MVADDVYVCGGNSTESEPSSISLVIFKSLANDCFELGSNFVADDRQGDGAWVVAQE